MKTKGGTEVVRAHLAPAPRAFTVPREVTHFPPFTLTPPDAIASETFTVTLMIALSWFTSKFVVGSRALNVYRNMPLLLGFSCWVHGKMPVLSSVPE